MPSSVEKLLKFLKLEEERGFDNRAVVGGLDKIIPSWENEARIEHLDNAFIQKVVEQLTQYRILDLKGRVEVVVFLRTLSKEIVQHENQLAPKRETVRPFQNNEGRPIQSGRENDRKPKSRQESIKSKPSQNKHPEQMDEVGLDAPLTVLHGVGPQNAKLLQALGIHSLNDLLHHFPHRYDDYSQLKTISQIAYGDELTVLGTIQSISSRPVRNGQLQIIEAILGDGTGYLRLNWYNQTWLLHNLTPGKAIVVSGKIDIYLGRLVINSPEWEPLEQDHLHTNRIVPVYPLTSGITQRVLRKIMYQTISFWAPRLTDYMPESIRQNAGLMDLSTAIFQAHFPDDTIKLKLARERLAFDEIFFLQFGVLQQKSKWESVVARTYSVTDDWLQNLIQQLPFTLTNAQNKAVQEIRNDLVLGRPMNRLLQGDVGSGKTVVAVLASAMVTQDGPQVAILAPTSILAEQHYRSMTRFFSLFQTGDGNDPQIDQIRLLIGDTAETEKQEIRLGLEQGKIKIVIGTHALLEDPITFQDLQLVIVDEQHRFGVEQRAILRSKGTNPHLLVMTATPIPRSLALTIYGDLDLTVMDELPAGRQPIETHVIRPLERERAYQLIHSQIALGHQVFIIYPLVEKGEKEEIKAAVDEHARLQSEVFQNHEIGLLHGRMRPEDKEKVMMNFRDGTYKILVSTSVVEVGVDIPNATVMLIEGANRFGLAQLHQFRGRVGRGKEQSYCILIPDTENAVENERLTVMTETNDGFILAERDLDQRGPGDFLGTRQSGFAELHMANLTDIHMIEKARRQAQSLFSQDPALTNPQNGSLKKVFHEFWGITRGEVS
jgi:ATP-dependent DNA helicase RecG